MVRTLNRFLLSGLTVVGFQRSPAMMFGHNGSAKMKKTFDNCKSSQKNQRFSLL